MSEQGGARRGGGGADRKERGGGAPAPGGAPPADTTSINYFNKRAGLTWSCETYEMPNGCMALLPLCTSNPNSYTYNSTWAFFEKDGILYQLGCTPVAGYFNSGLEDDRAVLRQVLDGFE